MLPHRIDYKTTLVALVGLNVPSLNQRGAALPFLPLPAPGSHSREGWLRACALVSSSQKYLETEGVRQPDEKTFISMRPRYKNTVDQPEEHIYIILRLVLLFKILFYYLLQDVPILTLRASVVPFVAGIFGCFSGAVGAFFSIFFSFHVPKTCKQRKASGFHGEDADSPGCQHSQPDQSPQRQLPFVAAGSLHNQRWVAGLSQVLFPMHQ